MNVLGVRRLFVLSLAVGAAVIAALGAASAFAPVPLRNTLAEEVGPVADGGHYAWIEGKNTDTESIYTARGRGLPRLVDSARAISLGSISGGKVFYTAWKPQVGFSPPEYLMAYDLRTGTSSRFRPTRIFAIRVREFRVWRQTLLASEMVPDIGGLRIVLESLSGKRTSRVLDQVKASQSSLLHPGQVNDRYAVWTRCAPWPNCWVVRYDLRTQKATVLPNPVDKMQYAASVRSDGTVYLARSGLGCGVDVQILRVPLRGSWRVIHSLPAQMDIRSTYVDGSGARTEVYFDAGRCDGKRFGQNDIFKLVDP